MTHDEMIAKLRIVTQERDGLREQLAAEVRAKEDLGRILKAARSEAIMRQREHAAMLADSGSVRALVERVAEKARLEVANLQRRAEHAAQELDDALDAVEAVTKERDQARQEADLLRRQVEAMIAPIAAACGRFGHLDMVLEMAHDPDGTENTNPWHACARDLWRAVKAAKEGGK
jgi:hypothetical protein